MKRIFILLALVSLLHTFCMAQPHKDFSQWFNDKTLRIDYLRIGNKQNDTIVIQNFIKRSDFWSGSKTQLIDPFNNGQYMISISDSVSNKLLYSRGYNTLFREYCDTPKGTTEIGKFEEVVSIPYPINTIKITFSKRDKKNQLQPQSTVFFNPKQSSYIYGETITTNKTKPIELIYNGNIARKIDLAIVAQGYENNQEKAEADLKKLIENLFNQQPFKDRQHDFNVWGIIGDCGANYNTFDADRYLMTTHLFQLHNILINTPYDHIIIMVNNDKYGGGAIYNYYAITSTNSMSNMILPHELGHSIGGLADEYVDEDLSYNELHETSVEPLEPNITTLVDFESKWKDMLPEGTQIPTQPVKGLGPKENGPLGVYEGAGYQKKGIYRPATNCMMNYYAEFCPVCTKRLHEIFDLYSH